MGDLRSEALQYDLDGQVYESHVVHDSSLVGDRPGLLMAPNWMGITDGAIDMARKLASDGYVVFVADLYGKDYRPTNGEEAANAIAPLKANRLLLRRRMRKALEVFRGVGVPLNRQQLAAIGFCFGGCCVLELARDGADLQAIVSFHGTVDTPSLSDAFNIKAPVLVLDGASDPLVPREQLPIFAYEMTTAGVDWQLISYGGAFHSFTDPKANVPGQMMYDARTTARAFAAMRSLLDEQFGDAGR